MMPLRIALILSASICASAVESATVPVLAVIDGDTVDVRDDLGPQRVRLLWIDTPETRPNAHGPAMPEGKRAADHLRSILPPAVVLWGPEAEFERDGFGRILAVVRLPDGSTAQHAQVLAGWSPYWRKYGSAPEPIHAELIAVQAIARTASAGAWATAPAWMRDKANETTARHSRSDR